MLVQIFLDHTRLMPGRVMVLLVIAGVILGAVGIYEPLQQWAGCGASVPLSGFGYNLARGVMEAVNTEGFIGLFKGGFKAAAAGDKRGAGIFLSGFDHFQTEDEKMRRGKGSK